MTTHLLNQTEFRSTFGAKMIDITKSATNVIDIWPYVKSIPAAELNGHAICDEFVEFVYRSDDGGYDHVLVVTHTNNVYLVVVVDLARNSIHGHRLLDLNQEYGLK
jgi:hypothetical protein